MMVLSALIAYILGSIPFAYILGKHYKNIDIRTLGSGNVGTTNVLRNFGKKAAIINLILDMFKGYLAVFIGTKLAGYNGMCIAFLFVVIGHMYSIFLNFKSGKGAATSAGALLFVDPKMFLLVVIIFILTIALFKMVSLGSILACLSAILLALYFHGMTFFTGVIVFLCLLIIYKHRSNIKRILNGKESKIGK